MNLNIKLEDEAIFEGQPRIGQMMVAFHKWGIYTVNDFLNYNIHDLRSPRSIAFARILRYKYLNEPLMLDKTLVREYEKRQIKADTKSVKFDVIAAFESLGFIRYSTFKLYDMLKDMACFNEFVRIIDVINSLPDEFGYIGLKTFYIDYYLKMDKDYERLAEKQKLQEIRDELKDAQTQLDSLAKRRDELDAKIAQLQDENNVLEKKIRNKYTI